MTPTTLHKDLYAAAGMRYMTKVLALLDQNPFSATYGCGDRPYWLNKSVDFPCGMYGEMALPLALAYRHPFPDNPYQGEAKIRDLSLAVMRFQAASAHGDGSNDDFFPFERALGSTAFALYAMAEAAHHLEVRDPDILAFLSRRAHWLAGREESGRLSNHHALAAVGIAATHRLTGESGLKAAVTEIRDKLIGWQTDEGWFPEYDGFDPGYDTFTIAFLAHLRAITGDDVLTRPLEKAALLAGDLAGPDGSYGGEIGNRNSYHFVPFGFELLAPEMGAARFVADRCLAGLAEGRRPYLDDNRAFCHYQYCYLLAWLNYADRTQCPDWSPAPGLKHWPQAGLARVSTGPVHALVSLRKGGVIKAATSEGPLGSDTGIVVADGDGRMYAPVIDGPAESEIQEEADGAVRIEVRAPYKKVANTILPTPFRLMVLRLLNVTVGRVAPNLLRSLIQHLLIKRKKVVPLENRRVIRIGPDGVNIEDHLSRRGNTPKVTRLAVSTDLTTIYTASSNPWHPFRALPWTEMPEKAQELNSRGRITVTRAWKTGAA